MFEKLIVLAPDGVHDPVSEHLRYYNAKLDIIAIKTADELSALSQRTLAQCRLMSFTCPIIVPPQILMAVGYGAYNFHPAPPTYPGLAPALFAIYEGARVYGATAHVMLEKVDSGPIVGVEFCDIRQGATVADIEMEAFALCGKIFRRLSRHLASNPAPLPLLPVTWSGRKSNRRMLTSMCQIAPDIGATELNRRVRAFADNQFGIQPTITLHGYDFRLVEKALVASEALQDCA